MKLLTKTSVAIVAALAISNSANSLRIRRDETSATEVEEINAVSNEQVPIDTNIEAEVETSNSETQTDVEEVQELILNSEVLAEAPIEEIEDQESEIVKNIEHLLDVLHAEEVMVESSEELEKIISELQELDELEEEEEDETLLDFSEIEQEADGEDPVSVDLEEQQQEIEAFLSEVEGEDSFVEEEVEETHLEEESVVDSDDGENQEDLLEFIIPEFSEDKIFADTETANSSEPSGIADDSKFQVFPEDIGNVEITVKDQEVVSSDDEHDIPEPQGIHPEIMDEDMFYPPVDGEDIILPGNDFLRDDDILEVQASFEQEAVDASEDEIPEFEEEDNVVEQPLIVEENIVDAYKLIPKDLEQFQYISEIPSEAIKNALNVPYAPVELPADYIRQYRVNQIHEQPLYLQSEGVNSDNSMHLLNELENLVKKVEEEQNKIVDVYNYHRDNNSYPRYVPKNLVPDDADSVEILPQTCADTDTCGCNFFGRCWQTCKTRWYTGYCDLRDNQDSHANLTCEKDSDCPANAQCDGSCRISSMWFP